MDISQQAHDIALKYLERAWKKGTISHENDRASMDCYIAAYKYASERLKKELRRAAENDKKYIINDTLEHTHSGLLEE